MIGRRALGEIYAEEPEHGYAVATCIRAWRELNTCRQIGMAVGPIPIRDVWAWCDRRGFDPEASEMIESVIMQLDQERAEREAQERAIKKAGGQ